MKTQTTLTCFLVVAFATITTAQSVKPATKEPPNPVLMFRAKVVEKKGTANNFTLRIQREDGTIITSEHTKYSFGSAPADLDLFDSLEVGKEYDFPKSMSADPVHFGLPGSSHKNNNGQSKPMAFMVVFDHCPVAIDSKLFNQAAAGESIVGLKYCPPFRAKVISKSVTDDSVSLTFRRTDGEQRTIVQNGNFGLSAAIEVVDRLDEGGFYEFPHVFSTTRSDLPREAKPSTPEMKALSKWIGQWRNVHDRGAGLEEYQKFTWKADGNGVWRETMVRAPGSERFDMVCASLITYDSEKKTYLETRVGQSVKLVMTRSWDADKQTLEGHIEWPGGLVKALDSTATFTSDDRIDWKSEVTLSDEGRVQTITGHYERM